MVKGKLELVYNSFLGTSVATPSVTGAVASRTSTVSIVAQNDAPNLEPMPSLTDNVMSRSVVSGFCEELL